MISLNKEYDLLKFRSEHIVDANNVSALLNKLLLSEYKSEVLIVTESEYCGITINYDLKNIDIKTQNIQAALQDNALVVFSLIENVEDITFNIQELENQYEHKYSRTDI